MEVTMGEQDNFVDVEAVVKFRTTQERFTRWLDMMKEAAIEPLQVGITDAAGNKLLFELPDIE
jgi:hypothetical protein